MVMTNFRRRKGSGKSYPITPRTLYGARIVEDAEASAAELKRDFDSAKALDKKEHVWRAAQEEANRLKVGAHNHNNSVEARRRLSVENQIFQREADSMHKELF